MTELTVDLKPGFELLTLERRLADTPADAHVRGLFFRLAEQALSDRSQDLVATWRAASGARMRWPFKMYSTREFIREQAIAAVLLDPGDPGGELRKMWAATPKLSSLIRAEGFIRYDATEARGGAQLAQPEPEDDVRLRFVASRPVERAICGVLL